MNEQSKRNTDKSDSYSKHESSIYTYINIHVGILVWRNFEYRRICPNWTGILSSNKMKIDEIQFLISTRLNWNDFLNE